MNSMKLFLLVSGLFFFSSYTFGAEDFKAILYCAATNDGDGGDEGYEVEIVESKDKKLVAKLILVDVGGTRVIRRIIVNFGNVKQLPTYRGANFSLTLRTDLPKNESGYIVSKLKTIDGFNSPLAQETYCK